MTAPRRCFVAFELPGAVHSALAELQGRLQRAGLRARWVGPGASHLTVKFLGELAPAQLQAATEALAAPLEVGGPLALTPAGLGAFPNPQRPRVLWAGIQGDLGRLQQAAQVTDERLGAVGFPRERRAFRPHLTLARVRDGRGVRGLQEAWEEIGPWQGPTFVADRLVLFESHLGGASVRYSTLQSTPLE